MVFTAFHAIGSKTNFVQRFMGNNLFAATFFSQAGHCVRKTDPTEAVKSFRKAVEYFSTDGKLVQAALCELECAKIHADDHALHEAATAYQFASDYYKKVGNFTQTIVLLAKAGTALMDAEEYVLKHCVAPASTATFPPSPQLHGGSNEIQTRGTSQHGRQSHAL